MKKRLLFSLAAFSLFFSAHAQKKVEYCGTPPGIVSWLRGFQENPSAFLRSPGMLYVPLSIHIVGTDNGAGHFPVSRILDAMCTLNEDFEASNIRFFIEGGFHYIDNSSYYDHDFDRGIAMMEKHNVPNTINCYFVHNPAGNCGYAFYHLGIALNRGCITEEGSHTWAHEAGHFLSLPHTFSGWEEVDYEAMGQAPAVLGNGRATERVDGANCRNAGDGFCDTPPDYLSKQWRCRNDRLSNTLQTDPSGAVFRSDGSLIMSYAYDECVSRFSDAQADAMRANLLNQRAGLLYDQSPAVPLEGFSIRPSSPAQGVLVTDVSSLALEWEPVEQAEGYVVELSFLSGQGYEVLYSTFHTLSNRVVVSNLLSDHDWLWRVRPYNRYGGCAGYSNAFTFETGNFINTTREEVALSDFRLQPNPQEAGGLLSAEFDLPVALELQLSIYSIAGKRINGFPVNGHYGLNTVEIPTGNLEPGLYLVGLEHAQGRQFRKILIQ